MAIPRPAIVPILIRFSKSTPVAASTPANIKPLSAALNELNAEASAATLFKVGLFAKLCISPILESARAV